MKAWQELEYKSVSLGLIKGSSIDEVTAGGPSVSSDDADVLIVIEVEAETDRDFSLGYVVRGTRDEETGAIVDAGPREPALIEGDDEICMAYIVPPSFIIETSSGFVFQSLPFDEE